MKTKELILILLLLLLFGIGCNDSDINGSVLECNNHNYVNGVCAICGDKQPIVIDNGYVYFGEYPQSLKDIDVSITSDTPDNDGYYLGSDGQRYAKISASPEYSDSFFDKTIVDASGIEFNVKLPIVNGTTYYFKVEPIKWKIEEENNGTYKLISEYILDKQMYYSTCDDRTIDGKNNSS